MMSDNEEFWDWKAEAPVKIDCSDYDGDALTYNPHGCVVCKNKAQYQNRHHGPYCYECKKSHNIVYFHVYRTKRPCGGKGRLQYAVMYRTHEPDERPEPIPAACIAEILDEIVAEGKAILPSKEGTYKNRFPGGTPEIARRIAEKATRLLDGGADCDTDADTEMDLLNYVAIHRAVRYREQGEIDELMSDEQDDN